MKLLLDAFWRAIAYCLKPRVIALTLLPLAIMLLITLALAYFFWSPAVQAMQQWLASVWSWLQPLGLDSAAQVLAPVLVVLGATPLIVIASLLMVALLLTPAMLRLVAGRRFAGLQRRGQAGLAGSVIWSLGHTALALLLLLISLPLWLVPPLILLLPPLIWGWLTYRVMSFDALAEHATRDERRALLKAHRWPLLLMGVACGYLGAAPGIVWASAALFAVAFAVLIPVAIWIYTLVFAFSSLWFSHYCLAALAGQREAADPGAKARRL